MRNASWSITSRPLFCARTRITGNFSYVIHSNEFKPPAEGMFVNYATLEGNYKIPAAAMCPTTLSVDADVL